jgi:hypothetical protein
VSKDFRIPVKVLDEGQALKIVQAVKRVGMLNVYSRWYEYYRPILKARFDEGSKTTPYAESSLGKRKRSGEIIKQVPQSKFNQDTGALYDSVTKDVKISNTGLDIETNVSYAPYALKHFTKKGSLAPEGLFKISQDDVNALELYLIEEYEDALGEIPDDLI